MTASKTEIQDALKALGDMGDAELPFDPSDVVLDKYEDMTREELIACCYAHDAHHAEHHAREDALTAKVPDGMVLVPKEPTLNMLAAFGDGYRKSESVSSGYQAMITAAQNGGE